jgi:hypothetical protein
VKLKHIFIFRETKMDFGGNMFCLNNRDQNNNTNGNSNGFTTWGSTSSGTTPTWNMENTFHVTAENTAAVVNHHDADLSNVMMFNSSGGRQHRGSYAEPYGGGGSRSHVMPDPHLTCLKLGKRHYFEDVNGGGGGGLGDKRGKGYFGGGGKVAAAAGFAVARCQVDGCHVALVNAKEYHRRHKVCEMHSKAPKVVVLGLEQRFCQQCSRSVCYSLWFS